MRRVLPILGLLGYLGALPAYFLHSAGYTSSHERFGALRCSEPSCACADARGRLERFTRPGHNPADCLVCTTAATMAADAVCAEPVERSPVAPLCKHAELPGPRSRAPLTVSCRSPPA